MSETRTRRVAIIWVPVGTILTALGGLFAFVGAGRALLGFVVVTFVAALYFLYRALFVLVAENPTTQEEVKQVEGRFRRELQREKRLLLKALAELELDYEMGKLSEKDYREASGNYRARIAKIFRQLDAGADYEALVNEELARRKRTKGPAVGLPGTPEPEPMPEPMPSTTEAPARRSCPKCAASNEPDADFCKKCGGALA